MRRRDALWLLAEKTQQRKWNRFSVDLKTLKALSHLVQFVDFGGEVKMQSSSYEQNGQHLWRAGMSGCTKKEKKVRFAHSVISNVERSRGDADVRWRLSLNVAVEVPLSNVCSLVGLMKHTVWSILLCPSQHYNDSASAAATEITSKHNRASSVCACERCASGETTYLFPRYIYI